MVKPPLHLPKGHSISNEEALDLFSKKNADYGDAFANFGPVGVIVRMGDKINRLSNVTNSNRPNFTGSNNLYVNDW